LRDLVAETRGDEIEQILEIPEAKCAELAARVRETNGLTARGGDTDAEHLLQKV